MPNSVRTTDISLADYIINAFYDAEERRLQAEERLALIESAMLRHADRLDQTIGAHAEARCSQLVASLNEQSAQMRRSLLRPLEPISAAPHCAAARTQNRSVG